MRKAIAVALAAGIAATPVAIAQGVGKPSTLPAKPAAKPAKHVPVVSMVFKGVVKSDAAADKVVIMPVRGTNIFARRALKGANEMTVTIGSKTVLRGIVIAADGSYSHAVETFKELKAGDRVMFHIRAKKGTQLDALPAAKWIRDMTATALTPPTVPGPTVPAPPAG